MKQAIVFPEHFDFACIMNALDERGRMNGRTLFIVAVLIGSTWAGSLVGRQIGNKFLGSVFGFSVGCYALGATKKSTFL